MLKTTPVFSLLLLLTVACSLQAQVDHSSLSGTITDPTHSMISGAKVEAVSDATGLRRQTLTGVAGSYVLPDLRVGLYTITVSKEGFRTAEFRNVELTVGSSRTIDAQLAVGAVSETVEVTATVDTMERSSAEFGGLVEPEQIREIPVSGRNWASLMLLVPER